MSSRISINTRGPSGVQGSVTDNEAALQFWVTKNEQPFLATQPDPGQAGFLTFMKPCSILLPHTHPRATEFYHILFGALRHCDCGLCIALQAREHRFRRGLRAARLHCKVQARHLPGTWLMRCVHHAELPKVDVPKW